MNIAHPLCRFLCKKENKKIADLHGGLYEPSGYVRSGVPRGVPQIGFARPLCLGGAR